MPKLQAVIFYGFIGVQLVAAVLPIRDWPLTDYPMFSYPRKEFKGISRLALEDVFSDRIITWSHADYSSVGLNDAKLQAYVNDVNHPRVFEIIAEKVKHTGKYSNGTPNAIRVSKITIGPDNEGRLNTTKEVLREIEFKELSN